MALKPDPANGTRKEFAKQVRNKATDIAYDRLKQPIRPKANTDLTLIKPPVATFTKGLRHDRYGFVDSAGFERYVEALNQGEHTPQNPPAFDVDLHPVDNSRDAPFYNPGHKTEIGDERRKPESPLGGHVYDLEGPDADAVAIPPAPAFGSAELTFEMAEVYGMALLRDLSFEDIEKGDVCAPNGVTGQEVVNALNALKFIKNGTQGLNQREADRREARFDFGDQGLTPKALFRGSTPGSKVGPYISQFLLIGNDTRGSNANATSVKDGYVQYGQQRISQKIAPHVAEQDFMTNWADWLDVQNRRNASSRVGFQEERFIHTPRDLATYVHYDALYQAYLNACLWLLGSEAAMDAGLPPTQSATRVGFATFGGPHILTLVTEVATRALKAVRRTKFQVHLRARPEAIGGALTLASAQNRPPRSGAGNPVSWYGEADTMLRDLRRATFHDLLAKHPDNGALRPQYLKGNSDFDWLDDAENWLLPMAFPEGSPVHGSYGAGHATVAGACVTILKAVFEMCQTPPDADALEAADDISTLFSDPERWQGSVFTTATDGDTLKKYKGADSKRVTLQGELDKLAANISVGRNFAGVHYYTDYYESLRLGERVAVGMLQEQMLTYREPVSMRLTSFDGDKIMILGFGARYDPYNDDFDPGRAEVRVWPANGGTPDWVRRPAGSPARKAAIRDEAENWWLRGL